MSDWMFGDPKCNNTNKEGADGKLLHTPVRINGIDGNSLVDCGATDIFVSKNFVQGHGLEVSAVSGEIHGGTGEKLTDRVGVTELTIENGTNTVSVMEMPEGRDLVIGLPHFPKFGYKVTGVPVKKPTIGTVDYSEDVEQIVTVAEKGYKPGDLDKTVQSTVKKQKDSIECSRQT